MDNSGQSLVWLGTCFNSAAATASPMFPYTWLGIPTCDYSLNRQPGMIILFHKIKPKINWILQLTVAIKEALTMVENDMRHVIIPKYAFYWQLVLPLAINIPMVGLGGYVQNSNTREKAKLRRAKWASFLGESRPLQEVLLERCFNSTVNPGGGIDCCNCFSTSISYSKTFEREIKSWLQWFTDTYPNTGPMTLFRDSKGKTDFRIFFLAYPGPDFALVRVLDACYAVDEAICGTCTSALAKVKTLWSMDRFEYLSSEELIRW